MAGHLTPMGAFSVIQKQKLHHSNIYSNAPMPFMQRITWSGIAMHAGVLPGYPASHGCIRMPMAFAVKMYGWTKMGARVVVTPGEMTPAAFSHPLLETQKLVPQPVAADMPKTDAPKADVTAKGDKAAAADPASKSETSVASLDLRSSIGHDSHMQADMDTPSAPQPLSAQTHTADASQLSTTTASVTMSDAAPSTSPANGNAAPSASAAPAAAEHAVSDHAAEATPEPKSGAVKSVAELLAANSSENESEPVEAKPTEAARSETKAAEIAAADQADQKSDQAPASVEAAKTDAPAVTAKIDAAKTEAKVDDVKAQTPSAEIAANLLRLQSLLTLQRPPRSRTKALRQRPMRRLPTPRKIRLARPTATRWCLPNRPWRWPRAPARFRCSSAARMANSMCGRISRRCSTFP